ncbi:vWA domain-containing protein [Ulvibacter litoralis]|uniref:VWA domain-containing protein n=1 Tax=Ulvibacter litoralis TaxID=227084 RepID=A0A1G7FCB9_9FLAO|nr:vWA domain-containing protein [Ulvibacter litoralis]GHC51756.1 hypothetical protein GCM10008083_14320 [Ulvibacter litoralis]SDE73537.1 hypothetical protein SAMN05421855_102472 [Ulvibacter litoralis]
MTAETILFIGIAGIFSLAVSVFMYGYKTKYKGMLRWVFGVLRFVTLFSVLLLLINPKFKTETYTVEKPKLPILIDNSASVVALNQKENVEALLKQLQENPDLNDRFDLSFFSFGNDFRGLDSLSFSEKNTNISKALASINELFKNETAPTVLISDGNQTLGADYAFSSATFKNQIFPIVLGDTTKHTDLAIEQLNTNRYAFLKNQFPIETILVYNGTGSANSQFIVKQGASVVYRKPVSFSETNNTQTISFTLPATSVGLQKYTAQLVALQDEKNTSNNVKQFAVEVIDQATNVLIVSSIVHPDVGALKKAIASNEQRTVLIKKPSEAAALLNDYQLVLLYQPDRSFSTVYSEIEKLKKNTFVITGLETDWNFLNNIQKNYSKEITNQTEDVSGILNVNYGTFAVDDLAFEAMRPLKTLFGALEITVPHEVLLEQSVDGFSSETPMLATMELNGVRNAIWDGEGLWKWRAQSFLNDNSFETFDNFTGKLVQYLASNKRRSRLEVSNETFYYNNNPIKISAQYFDQNFVFDSRASLSINVTNSETKERITFPLLLKNNFYEVDLNSLNAGSYLFTVSVNDQTVARSGSFTILDFNVEQQFLNADVAKLQYIANTSNGATYFVSQVDQLMSDLTKDNRYQQIQKSEQKVIPLIDWKYLLAIIVLSLTAEWFMRKYNGLI